MSDWAQPLQIKEAQKGPRLLLVISKVFTTATYQDHIKSHFRWLANQERLESGHGGRCEVTDWVSFDGEDEKVIPRWSFFFFSSKVNAEWGSMERTSPPLLLDLQLCVRHYVTISLMFLGCVEFHFFQSWGGKADCFDAGFHRGGAWRRSSTKWSEGLEQILEFPREEGTSAHIWSLDRTRFLT